MATTDYDFQSSRNDIMTRAFRLIGALSPGESMTGDMVGQAIQALNDMVKSWQSDRIFLWTLQSNTISLTASDATYPFSSDPPVISLEKAYLRISNNDQPLRIISLREYWDIEDKASTGQPTHVCVDNETTPTIIVWPVPTTSYTLYYLAVTKLQDWESAAGSADFPAKWTNALTYSLAAELAPEYGLAVNEKNDLAGRALAEFKKAAKGDRERSDIEEVESAFTYRRRR